MYSILDGSFAQIQEKSVMDYMLQLLFILWAARFQLSTTTVLPPSVALLKPSCMVTAYGLLTGLPYRGTSPKGKVDWRHLWYFAMRRLQSS
jgi:hypothetical protein